MAVYTTCLRCVRVCRGETGYGRVTGKGHGAATVSTGGAPEENARLLKKCQEVPPAKGQLEGTSLPLIHQPKCAQCILW